MPVHNRVRAATAATLAGVPLFAGLERDTLAQLAATARVFSVPNHHRVFSAGQPIKDVHYLMTGALKRYAQWAGDVEKVLELVSPGQMCALSETLAVATYASFAETLAPSTLLAIDAAALKAIAARHLMLTQRLLADVARSHYACEFDVMQHRSLSVTQRVLDYLLSLAEPGRDLAGETTVRLAASKRIIAARLDMAPETLSRTLRQLSDDGLIVVDKRTVHIQNAPLAITSPPASHGGQAAIHYPRMERGATPQALSSAELINLCGRQRMYSQRLTTYWALISRGIAVQESRVSMRRHREQVERNLVRLENGGLPPALAPKFSNLQKLWREFAGRLAQERPSADAPGQMFALSESLLDAVDQLTVAAARHAGTESAQLVNVAGRNRMLCARMMKLFVFDEWGVCPAEIPPLMAASRAEFLGNLKRLTAAASASPELSAQLQIDAEQWAHFLEAIRSANGGPANGARGEHALAVVKAGEELLRHADTTVKLCVQLAGSLDSHTPSGNAKPARRRRASPALP